MTLRYDEHGKPVGLDWSVCTDGNPRPEVWTNWRPPKRQDGTGEEQEEREPTHSRKRLAPVVEALIIRMYRDEKKSARECALAAGVKPPTVFKVLRRNGIESRGDHRGPRVVTPDQETEIVRLYVDEQQSSAQISRSVGVGVRTISHTLNRAGVRIRTASEAAKLDRARRAQRSA